MCALSVVSRISKSSFLLERAPFNMKLIRIESIVRIKSFVRFLQSKGMPYTDYTETAEDVAVR